MTEDDLVKMDKNLTTICDVGNGNLYGVIQVVFAGDFCRLDLFWTNKALYMCKDLDIFRQNINTLLHLRNNHRFKEDQDWGKVLERFQKHGPTPSNADKICTRLMCKKYCTTECLCHKNKYW